MNLNAATVHHLLKFALHQQTTPQIALQSGQSTVGDHQLVSATRVKKRNCTGGP
jgi:hypothetical protein